MAQVYLGLGGNEAHPPRQFLNALQALGSRNDTDVLAVSPLYLSTAIGPPQPDYVNACARLTTTLPPEPLRLLLKRLEQAAGRTPGGDRWGPRPLDLDILLYDSLQICSPTLHIPHKEVHNRRFVLQPLCDLNAELHLPNGQAAADLLGRAPQCDLRPCGWNIKIKGPTISLQQDSP